MAENLNDYFSSVFIREDISSLPVPEAKSDYLGQLIVIPEMVAKKIKTVPFEWKEANIIPLFKKGSSSSSIYELITLG